MAADPGNRPAGLSRGSGGGTGLFAFVDGDVPMAPVAQTAEQARDSSRTPPRTANQVGPLRDSLEELSLNSGPPAATRGAPHFCPVVGCDHSASGRRPPLPKWDGLKAHDDAHMMLLKRSLPPTTWLEEKT